MTPGHLRDVRVWAPEVAWRRRADGSLLVWQKGALPELPRCLSDRILDWAARAPDRTWMAERADDDTWRRVSYGQLAGLLGRVGGFLLGLGLSCERPLMILSGNSLEHAIIALSAQHVGVPSVAIAPAYSLIGGDFGKLREVTRQITPGAVFAADAGPFAPAIAAALPSDVPVIALTGDLPGRPVIAWADAISAQETPAARAAYAALDGDTVAKFLFTSGTTGRPKAVTTTQRMICANGAMVRDCYAYMQDEPPVVVDWAPWNHVASGSKVFHMTIWNGGTFYIDAGRPTRDAFAETVRNLREISPTWYFNVPLGLDLLAEAMADDPVLARSFFRDLKILMYAGAGLSQPTWDRLNTLAERATGARPLLSTGLGATETGPTVTYCTTEQPGPGNIGIPLRGVTMKLVPAGDKYEARFKGPNIMPGYWRDPDLSAAAVDDEGFYRMGDALRPVDPDDPARGFRFDGRLAENFKLASGTWVAVGAVKAALVDAFAGLVRDAVIAGENRVELGALLVPFRPAVERLVPGGAAMDDASLYADPRVRARLGDLLSAHARAASGSSTRVVRAMILQEPLDLNRGEVTDKGSINQRAVLANRAGVVSALYAPGNLQVLIAAG